MALLTDSFGEVSTSSSTGRVKTLPGLKSSPVLLKTDEKLRSSNAVKPPLIINLNSGRIKLSGTVIFGVNRTYGAFFRTLANFSSNQTFFRTEKYQFNWKLNHPSFAYTFFPSFTSPKKIDNNFVISLRPDAFTISKQIINLKTVNQDLIVPAFNTLSQSPYSIPNSNLKAYYIRTPFYASVENRQYGIVKSTNVYKSPHEKQTLLRQAYYAPSNTSDFVFEVVGQNVDSSILRYTADSIFTENSPNENYLLVPQANQSTTTKTLYFLNSTLITPFVVGETVRIRNVNNGYLELATVTNATSNSISYSSTNLPPEISGTFIESGSSIYKFQNYNSETATTNLTNYFNSIAIPGKRGKVLFTRTNSYDEVYDLRKVSKLSLSSPTVKTVIDLRSIAKLSSSRKVLEAFTTINGLPSYINPFKTTAIGISDNRNVNRISPSIPKVNDVIDLRRLPERISNIAQYRSVVNQPEIYRIARFESYRTSQIALIIDSRSTSYVGKIQIRLNALSYNTQVNTLQKKFISLKEVDDNLKDVYVINISKFINNQILTLPSNFGIYKLNTYKIGDFTPLKNVEFIQKNLPFYNVKSDSIVIKSGNLKKGFTDVRGTRDFVATPNYVRTYKYVTWTEVRFVSAPSKILIPLKATEVKISPVENLRKDSIKVVSPRYNIITSTLQNKSFADVKDIPYKLSVNKFSIPVATISASNYAIANISANIAQSTVSTTGAPTSPREVLYYVNNVPGFRNEAYYPRTSSYATIENNYTVANISANISQSTVSTTRAPTSPREVLYYVNVAPGIRNKAYYSQTSSYATIGNNYIVANIAANISQSTVSTSSSPVNARENLYYATLVPGFRNKAYYPRTSSYATIGNNYTVANISANISQSTVSTTSAPINARENLYYATLVPGFRNEAYYISSNQYFDIGGSKDLINVKKAILTKFVDIRGSQDLINLKTFSKQVEIYKSLPITFGVNRLSLYSPFNNSNPSEFRIEITGQNLDSSINRYTLDSIFTENNPNESYIWNKQGIVSSGTKTLYFPNQQNQKFFAGDVVKIINTNSGYVDYISIISATQNSITYTGSDLVPEISGTFIETGATLYSKLLSTTAGPAALRNFNVSVMTPGKNATKSFGYGQNYASLPLNIILPHQLKNTVQRLTKGDVQLDFSTKIKSIQILKKDSTQFTVNNINVPKFTNLQNFSLSSNYATEKLKSISFFKDLPIAFTVNQMKRFDPDNSGLPSDFTLSVTDQSLNQFSNYYYDTDTIFIENNAGDSYVWSKINRNPPTTQPTTKTLFFENQRTERFKVGEKVRIRNVTTGRSTIETIISCTFNSITISPSLPITEISNTFIDSGSTTYGQSYVRTNTSPINPREKLYYSIIAQSIKSNTIYPQGTIYADTTGLNNTTSRLTQNVLKTPLRPVYAENYLNRQLVVRFKTGDFKRGSNGTQDPAAIKKAPVQFWS